MNNFINLTSRVINKYYIVEIIKKPDKYIIYMNYANFSGNIIFGSGYVATNYDTIEICKKKNTADYTTITNFITYLH
jgi:hypothetical protein